MKKFSTSFTILRTFLLLFILSLPFMGSDCSNILSQNTGNISGTWTLNNIQGNLQDVCLGEVMVLPSNTGGTATLTCPGQSSISADYTFSNDMLTYTSGVSYSVNSSSSTVLILTGTFTSNGITSNRILSYNKTSANDKHSVITAPENGSRNSSEKILSK